MLTKCCVLPASSGGSGPNLFDRIASPKQLYQSVASCLSALGPDSLPGLPAQNNVIKVLGLACQLWAGILCWDLRPKTVSTKCCVSSPVPGPAPLSGIPVQTNCNKTSRLACQLWAEVLGQDIWPKTMLTKCCFLRASSGPMFFARNSNPKWC